MSFFKGLIRMYKKRKVDAECRTFEFDDEWRSKYFFTFYKDKPVCLICHSSVSVTKKYIIKRHFESKHINYLQTQNINENGRKKHAKLLLHKLTRQQNIFTRHKHQ